MNRSGRKPLLLTNWLAAKRPNASDVISKKLNDGISHDFGNEQVFDSIYLSLLSRSISDQIHPDVDE